MWGFFDPLYLIICLPFMLLGLWAQVRVKSSFAKWSRLRGSMGLTGAQAAAMVLREGEVEGVSIEETPGDLSDHYDPKDKVIRLSSRNFHGNSVAALGVAAHEAGHAIQHAQAYTPLVVRGMMVPAVNLGGNFFPILFIVGAILAYMGSMGAGVLLIKLGFVGIAAAVVFSLITLPVEFDASRRAIAILENTGMLRSGEEITGARSVLNAAAMTYVAAAVSLIALLVYYLIRFGWVFAGRRG